MQNAKIFDEFPTIKFHNNFILRRPLASSGDVVRHFECSTSPLITPFLPDSCIPKTEQDALSDLEYFLNMFNKKNSFFWIIADSNTNEYIGNVGFNEWDRFHNRVEIAYELLPDYWNQGIATSAVGAAVRFAFLEMNVSRIQATTLTHNNPSIRVLRKNNFVIEGILNQYKYHHGQFVDIVMLGCTAPMFKQKMEDELRQKHNTVNLHEYRSQKQKKGVVQFEDDVSEGFYVANGKDGLF